MDKILSLIGILLLMVAILVAAWAFTRWAGRSLGAAGSFGGSKRLQILDRISLDRNQSILVVRAGDRYFLVSSGGSGASLLAELSYEEGVAWEKGTGTRMEGLDGAVPMKIDTFRQMFQAVRKNKKD
ncbi:MAG: flagellar biosynthetic protein FliO [Firmicutes bacterium]|nr:flagellar biosynthetic protein FliO [Bacillota bacterium]